MQGAAMGNFLNLRLCLLGSCAIVALIDSAAAFRHHGIHLNAIKPVSDGFKNQNALFEHLGHISHRRGSFSSRIRQKSALSRRDAATVSGDRWLSDKDVDNVLREEGPGSMRPAPMTHAERYTSRDWLRNLFTTASAFEFKRVFSFVFANTLFATMVWASCIMFPKTLQILTSGIGPQPHLLIGGVLGLLLIFRTNTAYDRFWEGRRLWSFLISRIRELARLGHSSLRGLDREHFLQLVAAVPPILLQHLQSGWKGWSREENAQLRKKADEELMKLVPKEDLAVLLPSNNRPFLLVKMIGNIISKAYTDPERVLGGKTAGNSLDAAVLQSSLCTERLQAETMLMGIVETIGGCENIVKTTVPLGYSKHTSRFLSMWCFTLPLVLVDVLQWRMIPLVFIASWALSIIDEVGHVIEDPFNMAFSGTDELKLTQSFSATRQDVMERLPAKERRLLDKGGNKLVKEDYDVTKFHQDYISRPNILRVPGSFPSLPVPSRSRRALVATAAAAPAASREWDEYVGPAPQAASGDGEPEENLLVATAAAAEAGWDMWLAWLASASVLERQAVTVLGSVCAAAVAVSGSISVAEALAAAGLVH